MVKACHFLLSALCLCLVSHTRAQSRLRVVLLDQAASSAADAEKNSLLQNALSMRIDEINQDPTILPNHELYLAPLFTTSYRKFLSSEGATVVEADDTLGVVGSKSSSLTIDTHIFMETWQRPHVGFTASSPLLSNSQQFPYFLRTNPSFALRANVLVEFLKYMNWNSVSVLGSTDFNVETELFVASCRSRNVEVKASQVLKPNSVRKSVLVDLASSGSRVFVLVMNTDEIRETMLRAASRPVSLVGDSGYAWLTTGDPDFAAAADKEQARASASSATATALGAMRGVIGLRLSVPSASADGFARRLNARMGRPANSRVPHSIGFAADAVSLLAYGANMLSQAGGAVQNNGAVLLAAMKSVSFDGVTGRVALSGKERVMDVQVVNQQDLYGSFSVIGEWSAPYNIADEVAVADVVQSGKLRVETAQIVWPSGTSIPPQGPTAEQVPGAGADGKCASDTIIRDLTNETLVIAVLLADEKIDDRSQTALRTAVEEINLSPSILGGKKLHIVEYEYKNEGELLSVAGKAVNTPGLIAVLGPAVYENYVELVHPLMRSYSIPHFDYSTASAFSYPFNRNPDFFCRSAASDVLFAQALTDMLRYYGWTKLVFVYSSVAPQRGKIFREVLRSKEFSNVTILDEVMVEMVAGDNVQSVETGDVQPFLADQGKLEETVLRLRETGTKVVVTWFERHETFQQFFSTAFELKFAGRNITYVVPSYDVVESLQYNSIAIDRSYSPRMLVELEGTLFLYPQLRQQLQQPPEDSNSNSNGNSNGNGNNAAVAPAPVPSDYTVVKLDGNKDSAFVANPLASYVSIHARDAVYMVALTIQRVLEANKNPHNGTEFMDAVLSSTVSYITRFDKATYQKGRSTETVENSQFIHSIAIDGRGERKMSFSIYNIDFQGVLNSVGTWVGDRPEQLQFYGNVNYVGGFDRPHKDTLCEWQHYWNVTKQACWPCSQDSEFVEEQWRCGPPRGPLYTESTRRMRVGLFVVAILVFLVAADIFIYLVKRKFCNDLCTWVMWVEKGPADTPDWDKDVVRDAKHGFRCELVSQYFMYFLEFFNMTVKWVAGIATFLPISAESYFFVVVAYFVVIIVITVIWFAYMYWRGTILLRLWGSYRKANALKAHEIEQHWEVRNQTLRQYKANGLRITYSDYDKLSVLSLFSLSGSGFEQDVDNIGKPLLRLEEWSFLAWMSLLFVLLEDAVFLAFSFDFLRRFDYIVQGIPSGHVVLYVALATTVFVAAFRLAMNCAYISQSSQKKAFLLALQHQPFVSPEKEAIQEQIAKHQAYMNRKVSSASSIAGYTEKGSGTGFSKLL